ncbi:hypothetical protein Q1695_002987 [Nippostrongylus brasiliensis]|nr:hypothetical protein Q1695_002987 [Nippostrongylus brasiliensis]
MLALKYADCVEQRSANQLKREQSLATLEGLKQRTQQARDDSVAKSRQNMFSCATSADEMPDVFLSVDEIIGRTLSTDETTTTDSPALPYYMAVRLTRKKRKTRKSSPSHTSSVSSYDEDCVFGNKLKREFWYAVPRSKADNIYHFLLQWSPDKYGQTASSVGKASTNAAQMLVACFIEEQHWRGTRYHWRMSAMALLVGNVTRQLQKLGRARKARNRSGKKRGKIRGDTTTSTLDESSVASTVNDSSRDDRGFIVLDSTADESLAETHLIKRWSAPA